MIITSIDFETANHSRASICAAGMAVFVNGTLTETPYWLVRPPQGHGWFREDFIECHGLTHLDVRDAPQFPDIAPTFLKWLTCSDIVIAHNAPFDIAHLRVTLEHFGLPCPGFDYLCTCKLARRVWPELPNHKLHTLAEHVGHAFNHHHAGDDAETAGRVLLAMMREVKATTLTELLQQTGVVPERFEKIDILDQEDVGAAL
ncbi:MAG: hypothetical protein RL693_441 [Verrucomicrobiota bacterium]|jgi:DNA polymerase-3 subunit epsilon